jgi:hypothetical protein
MTAEPMPSRKAPATAAPPRRAVHHADPGAWRLALALFGAAILVRAAYLAAVHGTACLDINLDPISDMEAFHRWALSIVSGDWLGRSNFHPWHPWQEAVAPRSQWEAWYGNVFHQEPFYPYLLAVVYSLAPRSPSSMIVLQAILGAAGCAFTGLAARRVAGEGAGLAAGLLAVFYGPFLYYESLLLRDAFLIPLHALMLWLVLEAWSRRGADGETRWWGAAGAVMGLSFLTKASILPFTITLIALAVWRARAGGPRERWRGALAIAGAFCLVASPLVARNVVVGAPWLQTTTRGPIEFINGNNPWHPGIGWFDGDDARVSAYARETLAASGGRLFPTIRRVVGGWSGRSGAFVWLQVRKLGYAFAPFEMPNNASYAYFRSNVGLLRRATVSFLWVAPLAALGALVSWRRAALLVPVYALLALGTATTVAFYVIARFRAPLMPGILLFAGIGAWSLVDWARRRRLAGLSAGAGMVLVLAAVNAAHTYPDGDLIRPQDHIISIASYRARGETERALREAHEGRARFPGFGLFWRESGLLEMALGRTDDARSSLREALSRDPRDAEARSALERLQRGSAADILPPR